MKPFRIRSFLNTSVWFLFRDVAFAKFCLIDLVSRIIIYFGMKCCDFKCFFCEWLGVDDILSVNANVF